MISVFDFCRSFPLNHNTNLERVRVSNTAEAAAGVHEIDVLA